MYVYVCVYTHTHTHTHVLVILSWIHCTRVKGSEQNMKPSSARVLPRALGSYWGEGISP